MEKYTESDMAYNHMINKLTYKDEIRKEFKKREWITAKADDNRY